jgi:hypothetical protein
VGVALAVAVGVAAAEERVGVGVPATEGDGTGCAEAGSTSANQASTTITSPAATPKAPPRAREIAALRHSVRIASPLQSRRPAAANRTVGRPAVLHIQHSLADAHRLWRSPDRRGPPLALSDLNPEIGLITAAVPQQNASTNVPVGDAVEDLLTPRAGAPSGVSPSWAPDREDRVARDAVQDGAGQRRE